MQSLHTFLCLSCQVSQNMCSHFPISDFQVIPHILFRPFISFTFKIICYSHTPLYSKLSATPILSTVYVVDTTIPSIHHSHYIRTDRSTLKQSIHTAYIQRSENWTFGCGTGIPPAGATSPLVTSSPCFSNPTLFPYPLSLSFCIAPT